MSTRMEKCVFSARIKMCSPRTSFIWLTDGERKHSKHSRNSKQVSGTRSFINNGFAGPAGPPQRCYSVARFQVPLPMQWELFSPVLPPAIPAHTLKNSSKRSGTSWGRGRCGAAAHCSQRSEGSHFGPLQRSRFKIPSTKRRKLPTPGEILRQGLKRPSFFCDGSINSITDVLLG